MSARYAISSPPAQLEPGEEPDVKVAVPEGHFGIEVTQLHEPPAKGRFSRREVETFHADVMQEAENIYAASDEPPVDVLVYFGRPQLRNVKRTAQHLVDFVQSHPPLDGCETFSNGAYAPFAVVRISEGNIGPDCRWRCNEGGIVPILTQELLSEWIDRKNRKLSGYLRNVDRIWLLLASPIAPFSSSFSVPNGVVNWRFDFDFEKVLLYSWEDGVIEIQRQIR